MATRSATALCAIPMRLNENSLYFLRDGHAGGLVFAFWKNEVRQFLIDNGKMLLEEYHLDGLRYDQVTVIDEHGGWFSARTSQIRCAT